MHIEEGTLNPPLNPFGNLPFGDLLFGGSAVRWIKRSPLRNKCMKTGTRPPKKLNVHKLRSEEVGEELEVKMDETMAELGNKTSISEC